MLFKTYLKNVVNSMKKLYLLFNLNFLSFNKKLYTYF